MNQIDLKGRRAVITGGAQGIGRAIAERLLDSGADVSLWDRDRDLVFATAQELSSRSLSEIEGGGDGSSETFPYTNVLIWFILGE